MAAIKKPTRKKKPLEPLVRRMFPIPASEMEILRELAADASDQLGQSISMSSVVRACIRLGEKEMEAVLQEINNELSSGRLWGSRPR